MFSDSHCHLRDITNEAIEDVKKKGLQLLLTAGIDLTSSEKAVGTARKYRIVKACVGIHPWNADQYSARASKSEPEETEQTINPIFPRKNALEASDSLVVGI